ncbi:HOG (high osmolarity glycerol) pathway protein [Exophiala dermatitidis]|nr:HOG (high osmolarity glycerol) pathway protein [Exophiala dermatitidis]
MATLTASPPNMSSPMAAATATASPPSLTPLITTTSTPRRTSSQRPTSYVERRMSTFSTNSQGSHRPSSRPTSHVFPAFHSSLPYTLVRDFAYPPTHPLHYGPPPDQSGTTTPVSETRRLSDPAIASWEDSRVHWLATPPWISETSTGSWGRDRLPAMTFQDGGPPYSEDEDIQSPIVTTSRNKKHKSNERGRSPGAAGPNRGVLVEAGGGHTDYTDGPGEAVDTYDNHGLLFPQHAPNSNSNFASQSHGGSRSPYNAEEPFSEEDYSEADDDARFSKDYSFTIASPDEEMHGKAVALFDFESEHQNELPLKEGQIILVSYRHGQGWLVAEDPRTGESGLVPEEFVRLVRDIEGGLHGLNSVTLDDGNNLDSTSPISTDANSSLNTPVPGSQEAAPPSQNGHAHKQSNNGPGPGTGVGATLEKHPSVQSNFSTSSRDFSPYPLPGKTEDVGSARAQQSAVQSTKEREEAAQASAGADSDAG